jgi:hypothetical protein
LRAHLEEQQVEPGLLIFLDALAELFGCADEVGPEASVGDAIFLQLEFPLELRTREPLVEIVEPFGRLRWQRGDPLQLALRLASLSRTIA